MDNWHKSVPLNRYRYADLKDPLNMRILTLIPADPSNTTIDCELEEWTTMEREYEALSWCWAQGDSRLRKTLRIHTSNGVEAFEVLEHLYDGLLALRWTNTRRYLWVDALCIHQAKVEERNQQVPRMKDIYGKASNVCVWLGKPKDETEQAETKLAFDFVQNELLKLWDFDRLCQVGDPEQNWHHGPKWTALLNLMKLPWFSRRWIVQEISLSKRGTVHCGGCEMDWRDFADAVSLFVQVEETPSKLSKLLRKTEQYVNEHNFFEEVPFLGATLLVKTTKDIYQHSAGGGHYKQLSLESLVSRLAIFKTAEPRDTIYGLLAMARDSEPYANHHEELRRLNAEQLQLLAKVRQYLPKTAKARYDVNYRSQVIDVYQSFMAFSIRNADPLRAIDIICRPFAQTYRREQDFSFDPQKLHHFTEEEREEIVRLPSWVPQIKDLPFDMQNRIRAGAPSDSNPLNLRMTRVNGDSFVGSPVQKIYGATAMRGFNKKELKWKKWKSKDNEQGAYSMFVEGFILDHVQHKEESAQGGNIPHTWLERLGWRDRSQDPPDKERWDEFWRTLVGNRDSRGSDPPIYYQRACREILVQGIGNSNNTFIMNDWNAKTPTPITEFLRRVQSVIWGRCLIETQSSRFGLVKNSVRPDDYVCILYGCSVPVILRRIHKKDSEMKREEEELDEDDKIFEQLSVQKLRRVFARRKAIRESLSPQLKKVPMLQTLWQLWIEYNALHYVRFCVIFGLAMWINQKGESLTAVLLGLISCWYMLSSPNLGIVEPRLNKWTILDVLATVTSISAASTLFESNLAGEFQAVSISFSILFPKLLTLPSRALYNHARDLVEERLYRLHDPRTGSAHTLRNIPWRIVDLLIKTFTRQKKNPRERRQYKWYYELICECYIHGMMDGEAIDWQFRNKVKSTTFEIR